MFDRIKRFMGIGSGPATMYQPGTGRIVAARSDSGSGVNVTAETALTIPAIYHGLRTYGQVIGARKWDVIHHMTSVVEGVEHRRTEVARNHPVHILLHSEPNEFQNASEWRETMLAHAILTGNGFSYIERNGNYRPTALLPLLPEKTRPVVSMGRLSYVTNVNGVDVPLDADEVFHVKGFSWDGISGIPLWRIMRDTLGLDKAQAEFASKFYRHGTKMGGVFTSPGALSDTARQNLKESMEREYGGVGNAFRTIFLEEGFTYSKMTTDPDKAQFIEGRRYGLGELARVIGLAPHLLFDLSQSTNNNIEHQGISAVTYSFEPWTNKLCQEANRKLFYESERWEYETRIDLKPLQQGDSLSQAQRDQIRFNTLSRTPNELRAEDGLNPQPGGDTLYMNTAMLPVAVAIAKAMAVPAPSAPGAIINVGTGANVPTVALVDDDADDNDDTPPADPSAGTTPANGEPGPLPAAEAGRRLRHRSVGHRPPRPTGCVVEDRPPRDEGRGRRPGEAPGRPPGVPPVVRRVAAGPPRPHHGGDAAGRRDRRRRQADHARRLRRPSPRPDRQGRRGSSDGRPRVPGRCSGRDGREMDAGAGGRHDEQHGGGQGQ